MTDDSKTIYTEDGTPIPWFNKSLDDFLDKTTLVFGGTGSGKTTIIQNILYICKDYIPNYLVIVPRTSDKAYRKKLPPRCIKEDLTKKKLQKVWDRQFYFTQLYNIANDSEILEGLFLKTPDRQSAVMVKAIMQRAKSRMDAIDTNPSLDFAQKTSQKNAIEELRNKKIKMLYKRAIRQYKHILEKRNLDDKEKIALEYLDSNPRLMLIIDDCSDKIKTWMKYFKSTETNPFNSIFFQGRWNFITLIFAAHDDKLIDTELRKNARTTFFMNSQALVASLNKSQSGYTTSEKKLAMKMATRIFAGENDRRIKTHEKFCYIREDPHPLRYTIATLYPDFILGCTPMNELISRMPEIKDNLDSNPFLSDIVDHDKKSKKKKIKPD